MFLTQYKIHVKGLKTLTGFYISSYPGQAISFFLKKNYYKTSSSNNRMGVIWKFINIKVCLTPLYIAKNRHGKENN
jgi:hypothetical protein